MKELMKLLGKTGTMRHACGVPFTVQIDDARSAFGRSDVKVFNPEKPEVKAWVALDSVKLN